MPVDDLGDAASELRAMKKAIERIQPAAGGGDSSHAGSGFMSIALGDGVDAAGAQATAIGAGAEATVSGATAVGSNAVAEGGNGVAFGAGAYAGGHESIALGTGSYSSGTAAIALGEDCTAQYDRSIGIGANVTTDATDQIKLGNSSHTVLVDGDLTVSGTFSNPSARRLKQNITPAPCMVSIFPTIYEWEYIAAPGIRRIGPMADDLLGTDGERFLTFDDDGRVSGINKVDLQTAQIAALLARVMELEKKVGGCSCG